MIRSSRLVAVLLIALAPGFAAGETGSSKFWVCVSNERSGTVSIIEGGTQRVIATIPVGKRPRGIHPSPDGKTLYVAVSGSPITGPPKLDSKGAPIFEPTKEEDTDRSADGIGVIDLTAKKFLRKLPAGADPEKFAVAKDGQRLYVSNEDVATASVVNIADGKVAHIIRVKKEPEGVALTPNGKYVYVTCETGGEVVVIDTATHKPVAELAIGGRPRNGCFPARRVPGIHPVGDGRPCHRCRFAAPQAFADDQTARGSPAHGDGDVGGWEASVRQHWPGRDRLCA